jgi:hypothetical protein
MPQFDFFIWFSLSLGTIITFQLLYYFILYYILAPFADLQKTLIKLYSLKQTQQSLSNFSLFEELVVIYFQKNKLKRKIKPVLLETQSLKKDSAPKLYIIKNNSKKKIIINRQKNTKNIILTKKDKFFKKFKKAIPISLFFLSKIQPTLEVNTPAAILKPAPKATSTPKVKKGSKVKKS